MRDPAVNAQRIMLQNLRDAGNACKALSKACLLFGGFRAEMFDESSGGLSQYGDLCEREVQKQQDRAAYEATERLLASAVRTKLLADMHIGVFVKGGGPKAKAQHGEGDAKAKDNTCASEEEGAGQSAERANVPAEQVLREEAAISEATAVLTLDEAEDVCGRTTQKKLCPEDKFQEFQALHAGFQHYIELNPKQFDDPTEMLFMWLKGFRPLPKCTFVDSRLGTSCNDLSVSEDVQLCNNHRCHLPIGSDRVRCGNAIGLGRRFLCDEHGCRSQWGGVCEAPRMGIDGLGKTREDFCRKHGCFKCVEAGDGPAGMAYDDPPRHTCLAHPLCLRPKCFELQKRGGDYCEAHSVTYCNFSLPNGWQCCNVAVAHDLPYCMEHAQIYFDATERRPRDGQQMTRDQSRAVMGDSAATRVASRNCDTSGWGITSSSGSSTSSEDEVSDTDDPELAAAVERNSKNRKCAGKNKAGKPCGAFALPGSNFCHVHAPPSASFADQKSRREASKSASKTDDAFDARRGSNAIDSRENEIGGGLEVSGGPIREPLWKKRKLADCSEDVFSPGAKSGTASTCSPGAELAESPRSSPSASKRSIGLVEGQNAGPSSRARETKRRKLSDESSTPGAGARSDVAEGSSPTAEDKSTERGSGSKSGDGLRTEHQEPVFDTEEPCLPPADLLDAVDSPGYDNQDEVDEADAAVHLREIGGLDDSDDEFVGLGEDEDSGQPSANFVKASSGLEADAQRGDLVSSGGGSNVPSWSAGYPGAADCAEVAGSTSRATRYESRETRVNAEAKDPKKWTWGMSLRERWEACEDFMMNHKKQLDAVHDAMKARIPLERKKLQEAIVRANAKAYENKSVIFGTIVGCIGRLEAIRATNPFAILVEEASEVLEPLLYACVGPSTVKFEMIGDHLQLSPSIMQVLLGGP